MELVIKQAPVIEYSIVEKIGSTLSERLAELNLAELPATEESKALLKNTRSTLNKESSAYDNARKEIKKAILKPYEEFEESVKVNILSKYIDADVILKNKIDEIEQRQRDEIKARMVDYFNTVMEGKETINFITFDKVGLNITLSASENKMKEQIKAFVDRIEIEMLSVKDHPHSQRLQVKYEKSLNLAQAQAELMNELHAENRIVAEKQVTKIVEPKATDLVYTEPKPAIQDEIIEVTFTVTAELSKVKALKQYMIQLGIQFKGE